MSNYSTRPRILFVTPEVTFVPEKTGNRTYYMGACSGCFGDFLAELINDLLNLGVDVHVAQPDYRKLFAMLSRNEQTNPSIKLPIDRVHLAEDRVFFYSNPINSNYEWENIEISLNFQREVINQIAPRVQPDLIHCHDWMTGLIPAAAKEYEMPCLFTVQNSDSAKSLLSYVEDRGIDAAAFWRRLFYDRFPGDYEEIRDTNPLDLLLSGILAAHHVNTARPVILSDIVTDRSDFFYSPLRQVLAQKWNVGCACAISSTPDPSFNPTIDKKQKRNHVMRQRPSFSDSRSKAQRYIDLYETILQRSLAAPEHQKAGTIRVNSHTKISDGQVIPYRKARSTQSYPLPNERISTPAMAAI